MAVFIEHEGMVEVFWFGKLQESLQDPMKVGGVQEILAAGDVSDLLSGVIDHDRQMIRGPDVFAGQDGVAEEVGIDLDGAVIEISEGEWSGESGCSFGVETPGGFAIGGTGFQSPTSARIERTFGAMGGIGQGGEFGGNLPSGAIAGVEDSERAQGFKGGLVVVEPVQLFPWLIIPAEAQKTKVFEDPLVVSRPDPGVVDVFKSKEKAASVFAREVVGHPGRVGVPEVKPASGTWGEAGGDHEELEKSISPTTKCRLLMNRK